MGTSNQANSNILIGAATDIGGKPEQQDDYLVLPNFLVIDNQIVHLIGIFDGHGNTPLIIGSDGKKAANEAKALFPTVLSSLKDTIKKDPLQALKNSFTIVNDNMKQNQAIDTYLSGTTAVISLIIDNNLHVAHVGDSRLAVYKENDTKLSGRLLTIDHNCDSPEERKRVEAAGGRVEQLWLDGKFDGPLRIFKGTLPYPGIIVTRTLGDGAAQTIGVLPDPDVQTVKLSPEDKYLVFGTDGLWDGLSVDQVGKVIMKGGNPIEIANKMLRYGLDGLNKKHIDDNITLIVCRLSGGILA
ncbi:hypothetical protein HDV04_004541 [Boothiomyces sp. JEL0838]|nr:hypothetical protein HDV04_004541 [Boothiomyces sp. JEL0838]